MRSCVLNDGLRKKDNNDVTILTLVFLRIQVIYEVAICPWMSGSRYFEKIYVSCTRQEPLTLRHSARSFKDLTSQLMAC
jgi:hypothetical protein